MALFGDNGVFPIWVWNADVYGDDGVFPLGPGFGGVSDEAKDFIAEILIGGVPVWSALNQIPQQELSIDVSGFTGILDLEFRIRGLP